MRKRTTNKNTPNVLLKYARELQGWSQRYVAEQVGTTMLAVNRWERGSALPTPDNRRRLCELFRKSPSELGLLLLQESEMPTLSSTPFSERSLRDPALPTPLTSHLVGRERIMAELKERLFRADYPLQLALGGLPGVGKTALALTLAHDSEVQNWFDGILWVRLGREPELCTLLRRWSDVLGLPADLISEITSVEEWCEHIHAAIGERRFLLIIDDVWKIDDVLAFKIGGPYCTHLITTRSTSVALQFAGQDMIRVQELNEDDGLLLVTQMVPLVSDSSLPVIRKLVESVGALPLGLVIIARYLSDYRREHGEQLEQALDFLSSAKNRLSLKASASPLSLQETIDQSVRTLCPSTVAVLSLLSVFAPKPHTFSEEAALFVLNLPYALDELTDAGLLEGCGNGRYMLHRTIADYALLLLPPTSPIPLPLQV